MNKRNIAIFSSILLLSSLPAFAAVKSSVSDTKQCLANFTKATGDRYGNVSLSGTSTIGTIAPHPDQDSYGYPYNKAYLDFDNSGQTGLGFSCGNPKKLPYSCNYFGSGNVTSCDENDSQFVLNFATHVGTATLTSDKTTSVITVQISANGPGAPNPSQSISNDFKSYR